MHYIAKERLPEIKKGIAAYKKIKGTWKCLLEAELKAWKEGGGKER